MKNEFAVVCFLDESRWDSENLNNSNLINYAHSNLTNEEKILTHWICYITDRQMPFELIWEVGGFVLSDMVKHYRTDGAGLLKIESPNSFFTGSSFKARKPCPADNTLLIKRGFNPGSKVEFTSRFYPSDYVSILYTLHTLERFGKDFVNYFLAIINIYDGQTVSPYVIIRGLAFGLYLLSYENIGQQNAQSILNKDWLALANTRTERIIKLFADKRRFIGNAEAFFKDSKYGKRYNIKRIWCSLRDYIKSPEFSAHFKKSLESKNVNRVIIDAVFGMEAKQTIELPGDVWNNNSTFRNCLFQISGTKDTDGEPFNRQLRKIFEHEHIDYGYPEQFDVTFDFVPRMCEKNLCSICPFKALYENNRIKKICVNNIDMFCSISLVTCGYVTGCKGADCALRKLWGNKNGS